MTTPDAPDSRDEIAALDAQIAELRRIADDSRRDLEETSDKTAAIEGAEQQEALIAQLELRRRDLVAKAEDAS